MNRNVTQTSFDSKVTELQQQCDNESSLIQNQRQRILLLRRNMLVLTHRITKQSVALFRFKQQLFEQQEIIRKASANIISNPFVHLSVLPIAVNYSYLEESIQLAIFHNLRLKKLIHQLRLIFPITYSASSRHWSIRSLKLPNLNLNSYNDEMMSTVIGYIVAVTLQLSRILFIPLKYKLVYQSSRSIIIDELNAANQKNTNITNNTRANAIVNNTLNVNSYPLYFKNTDETLVECGLILLQKNIQQMLETVIKWKTQRQLPLQPNMSNRSNPNTLNQMNSNASAQSVKSTESQSIQHSQMLAQLSQIFNLLLPI